MVVTADELRRLYWDEGNDLVALGVRYERSPGTVWVWFRKYGILTRNLKQAARERKSTVGYTEVARMVQLYESGLSSNDVGKELQRDGRLVRMHLERAGVLRKREIAVRLAVENGNILRRAYDMQFFDTWSPEMAWLLGLIFGDGNVHVRQGEQYVASLCGSKQVVQAACALLAYEGPVRQATHNGRKLNCWVTQWYSKLLVVSLAQYGLVGGSKSQTMQMPLVPEEMLSSFVRGLWDSDGGWVRRGQHLRANYSCSSLKFIVSLREILENRGWSPRMYTHKTMLKGKQFTGYRIELLAAHSRELARWLYQGSTPSTRCERKYEIALHGGSGKFSPALLPSGEVQWH